MPLSLPAGALLGLLSRWNLLKLRIDDEKCIKCGLCTQHCETQAHPYPNDQWKSGECVYCENCASICPTAAIGFRLSARPEKLTNVSNVDLSRRKLILTTLPGLVAVPFFRLTPSRTSGPPSSSSGRPARSPRTSSWPSASSAASA